MGHCACAAQKDKSTSARDGASSGLPRPDSWRRAGMPRIVAVTTSARKTATMHTQCNLRTTSFKQVDVFTSEPMRGNALAVVFDAEGLHTEDMQRVAAWTNLSETTFVLPPT